MADALRWYLRFLAALNVISAFGQLALPARVAAASAWGYAPGWQREIGFWNVAMSLVIIQTLRSKQPVACRTVTVALVVLQFLAATNHAAAAIDTHALLNTLMSAVNYAGVAFGLVALYTSGAAAR